MYFSVFFLLALVFIFSVLAKRLAGKSDSNIHDLFCVKWDVKPYLNQSTVLVSWEAHNKCSKCCPSARTHAVSHFLHLLMTISMTFRCKLPDIYNVLLQLIQTLKLICVLPNWKLHDK